MKRWIVPSVPLVALSLSLSHSAAADALPPVYAVGPNPMTLLVGDFDGDGRGDLAVLNSRDDTVGATVSVLLGNSDGTFQAARNSDAGPDADYGTGSSPVSLLSGDVNGDGKLDLIAMEAYAETDVLLGKGDGTFEPPMFVELPRQAPPTPTSYIKPWYPALQAPTAVAVGDLNGDGKLDLVVGGRTYIEGSYSPTFYWEDAWVQTDFYLNVMLGRGDGTFVSAFAEHTGGISDYVVADFDGDGRLDVAGSWPCGVRLGNGDGTLQPRLEPVVSAGIVADVDHDGRLDMVFAGSALRGMGDGTFQAIEGTSLYNSGPRPKVVDVNGDGHLDVVMGAYASTVYGGYDEILYYDPSGEYVEYAEYVGYDPVTTRYAGVALGYGNGRFDRTAAWDLGIVEAEGRFTDCVLADFDGDGLPDLAATDIEQGVVVVSHNPGNWPRPYPSFRIDDLTVTEGDAGTTSAKFNVRIQAPYDQEVAVDFSTQFLGGYTDASDFIATAGTVRFAPGVTSMPVSVEIKGDLLNERTEYFNVVLANPTAGASIADDTAKGTILDNDPRTDVLLGIGNVAKAEGRSGATPFVFTVTLSRASLVPVTVEFYTWDGTAISAANKGQAADYVASSGSLIFAPGVTTKSVTVQVTGDSKKESNETFLLRGSCAANGYVQTVSGTGTILNDD